MKHANIAIFVPHIGCPNQCSFCNQNSISGQDHVPTPQEVAETCRTALLQMGESCGKAQVAFFGGSFTAIDRDYRMALLAAVQPFLGEGKFAGIRISTRPDAITPEILEELVSCHVTAIELGVQSMDDMVLRCNHRGHTAEQVRQAVQCIRRYPVELGLQMMLGLYQDTPERMQETANQIVKLKPDTVRIYPALVLRHTQLAQWYQQGIYQPLELDTAVKLCANLIKQFEEHDIRVIRVGLHASAGMEKEIVAGPYHPAFRELCESERYLQLAQQCLAGLPTGVSYDMYAAPRELSKLIGQNRKNLAILEGQGYSLKIRPDSSLSPCQLYAKPAQAKQKMTRKV